MKGLDTRAIERGTLPQKPAPPVEQAFRIFVAEEAFDRAVERGGQDVTREVGGILVGEVCRDDAGPYVRVTTTIDALHAEEKGTELTITHATWEHVHKEMDTRHQGKRIVGWYHTHPGFGIFLSDRDQFIQRSFFDLPYQIALVYDPKHRDHGVFAWRDNQPARVRRYWIGRREHVWEGDGGSAASSSTHPPAHPSAHAAPSSSSPAPSFASPLPPSSAPQGGSSQPPPFGIADAERWTLPVLGLTLVVLGGLVGWWFGKGAAGLPSQQAALERTRGAEEIARALDADVLALLRALLDGERTRVHLDGAIRALEEGLARVPDTATEARTALRAAIDRLRAHVEGQIAADHNLRVLETLARSTRLDPRAVQAAIAQHGAVLGQLCAEVATLAGSSGDPAVARRLLTLAARIDPGNAAVYEGKLDGKGDGKGEGKLEQKKAEPNPEQRR